MADNISALQKYIFDIAFILFLQYYKIWIFVQKNININVYNNNIGSLNYTYVLLIYFLKRITIDRLSFKLY